MCDKNNVDIYICWPFRYWCIFQDDEEVKALGEDVKAFARRWPMPGFEVSELKFTEMDH